MGEFLETTISQMHVCRSPVGIKAESLGACVGVILWDSLSGIGGLVEIMQPYATGNVAFRDISKYADTGITELIRRLEMVGAKRENMTAKIAGGSELKELAHITGMSQMGVQNVTAVKQILNEYGIDIVAEDIGKDYSRTVYFYPETGKCIVTAPGVGKKEI